jgi:hypothetical protein
VGDGVGVRAGGGLGAAVVVTGFGAVVLDDVDEPLCVPVPTVPPPVLVAFELDDGEGAVDGLWL